VALTASLIVPAEYGTPLPQPEDMPAEMATRVRAWRAHPAGRLATRMFADQRGQVRVGLARSTRSAVPSSAGCALPSACTRKDRGDRLYLALKLCSAGRAGPVFWARYVR